MQSLHTIGIKNKDMLKFSVYLTDDGSTDGTAELIREHFPAVRILDGDGHLFWAGGMRNSWSEALKHNYDGYLLLNDDTVLLQNVFSQILETEKYSLEFYLTKGIYIGSTNSSDRKHVTYGGRLIKNKFLITSEMIIPDGKPYLCDLGNANIMYVSSEVIDKISILHNGYTHGKADYDYTLLAKKNGIPVLTMPEICGICDNDHKPLYNDFTNSSIKNRIKILFSPTGIGFKDQLIYTKRNFPYRYPFVVVAGILKVLLPKLYVKVRF